MTPSAEEVAWGSQNGFQVAVQIFWQVRLQLVSNSWQSVTFWQGNPGESPYYYRAAMLEVLKSQRTSSEGSLTYRTFINSPDISLDTFRQTYPEYVLNEDSSPQAGIGSFGIQGGFYSEQAYGDILKVTRGVDAQSVAGICTLTGIRSATFYTGGYL